jgi:hypothetical protein
MAWDNESCILDGHRDALELAVNLPRLEVLSVARSFDAALIARWHPRYDELATTSSNTWNAITTVARQISAWVLEWARTNFGRVHAMNGPPPRGTV